MEPLVEYLDLDFSEFATEWMDENGKIKDLEKLHKYLTETFDDPLKYMLEMFNEHLAEQQ